MEEIFYSELQFASIYSHAAVSMHQSCERVLLVSNDSLSWPELSKVSDDMIIEVKQCHIEHDSHSVIVYGVHTLKVKNKDFVYMLVASKLPTSRNYIICYVVQSAPYKIDKLQEFPVDYKPLVIIRASYDNKPIAVVTGSDGSVHAYEVSADGHLHRSKDSQMRPSITARLGTNVKDSVILRLLYEEWDHGNQYVSAFVNGRLHWNVYVNPNIDWSDAEINLNQPKPLETVFENEDELQYSYLLEGCICAVQFYCLRAKAPYASAGAESFDTSTQSSSVVVALQSGHVAVLSLLYESLHANRLPIDTSHGAAQAVVVADITQNGFNAIAAGFSDGNVIVCAPVDPPVNNINMSTVTFAPLCSISLPFPIMGLYFGQLLGQPLTENEFYYPRNQLLTVTSCGLHVHMRSDDEKDDDRAAIVKSILADLGVLSLKKKLKSLDSSVSLSSMCDRVSDANSVSVEDVDFVQTTTDSR